MKKTNLSFTDLISAVPENGRQEVEGFTPIGGSKPIGKGVQGSFWWMKHLNILRAKVKGKFIMYIVDNFKMVTL